MELRPACFLSFVHHEGEVETKVFSMLAIGPNRCCSLFDLGRSARPRKDLHWEHRERLALDRENHE